MRTIPALAVLLLCACLGPRPRLPPGETALTIDGRLEDGPLDLRAAEIRDFPRRAFRGREPVTGRVALFEGASVDDLLAKAVRPRRGADTLVVRSRDGREALVTRARLKDLRPILADRADGKPIAEWASEAGAALEAPLLAWPDLEQPGLALDPRVPAWWVSGVSTLVVESWVASYGRALALPPEASDQARRGVERVAGHCLPCHRVRGAGGTRGPDLARALAGWPAGRILARLEAHSTQAWLPGGADGDEPRREIAAFLQVVASTPAPPEDRAGEPEEAPRRPEPLPPPGAPRPRARSENVR